MKSISITSTTLRSAWGTLSSKVTASSVIRSKKQQPPRELQKHSTKTSTSQSPNVLYYTENGLIVYQTKSNKSWLI